MIELRVNGISYGGWLSASVSAGIERVARDFNLSITEKWAGQKTPIKVNKFDLVTVLIDGDLVMTGYVDATPVYYDGESITFNVQGRSKTAQLIDCAAIHEGSVWKGVTVDKVAKDLASFYGIEVVAIGDMGKPLRSHKIEHGESVVTCLTRAVDSRGLLMFDDERGRLILTRAGEKTGAGSLVLGQNILSVDSDNNGAKRYSEYRVVGQRAGTDDDNGASVAYPQASAFDGALPLKRVMMIRLDTPATTKSCLDRANWEAAYRFGKSMESTYRVNGWKANNQLWKVNEIVQVKDDIQGFNVKLLASEVNYVIDDSGEATTIKVAPREAYINMPKAPTMITKKKQTRGNAESGGLVSPDQELISFE